MNLKMKKTICLLVGIASILTIVSTISYAYFTATGEVKKLEAIISTGTASARFADNDTGITGELQFGESITKKFTIQNTGTTEARVKLLWKDLVNTYTKGSLTYTLSYSETGTEEYITLVNNKNIPVSRSSLTKILQENISIPTDKTYYYNLEITLNYLDDVNQNGDLNATFSTSFDLVDQNVDMGINLPELIKSQAKTGNPTFANPATTDEGIYSMEDDYGTSYYYRGAVENNYVKFAGFYWRIVRLNGDGSLRLIYDGTSAHKNGESSTDRVALRNQVWNAKCDDAKYVGYMFGGLQGSVSTSKEQAQTNETDSAIKKTIDVWYENNIKNVTDINGVSYGDYLSDTLFCNDRSTPGKIATGWNNDTGLGYAKKATAYGAYARLGVNVQGPNRNKPKPDFKCPNRSDAFTVSDTTKGNGNLKYPIGLITADEIVAAGSGKYNTVNCSYYLFKADYFYWTFSPAYFDGGTAYVVSFVNYQGLRYSDTNNENGDVVPVINISPEYIEAITKGDGSKEKPYEIG